VDERLLKRELLANTESPAVHHQPDVVVLASSRGMTLGQAEFRPDSQVINLAVSGASEEDFLGFGELILEQRTFPRDVVMAIDPWVFNDRSSQKRWVTNIDAVERFYRERGETPLSDSFTMVRAEWTRVAASINSLLGYSALRLSLPLEWARLFRGQAERPPGLVEEASLLPTDSGTRADGTARYPDSETTTRTAEELRRLADEYAHAEPVYGLGGWTHAPSIDTHLQRLISALERRGIRVHLLILPYHPRVLALLRARLGYGAILDDYERAMHGLASSTGASLCDMLDPAAAGCSELEFMDGMHAQQSCVDKWAKACALTALPDR
jgi:hypothetical protein